VKLLLRGLGEGVMPSVNPNNMLPNMLFLTTRDEGFRPTSKRSWSRDLKNFYYRRCFISGKVECPTLKLDTHHIFGAQKDSKMTYSLFNGVVLDKNLHIEFHRLYGNETTPNHFLLFIEYLSNQDRLSSSIDKTILITWIKLLNNKLMEGGLY
jgi:hypothetical protein